MWSTSGEILVPIFISVNNIFMMPKMLHLSHNTVIKNLYGLWHYFLPKIKIAWKNKNTFIVSLSVPVSIKCITRNHYFFSFIFLIIWIKNS